MFFLYICAILNNIFVVFCFIDLILVWICLIDEDDDERDEKPVPELRFVPENLANLDQMFKALSECQLLNPDPEDLSPDDDEEDLDDQEDGQDEEDDDDHHNGQMDVDVDGQFDDAPEDH